MFKIGDIIQPEHEFLSLYVKDVNHTSKVVLVLDYFDNHSYGWYLSSQFTLVTSVFREE